jgi:hypothetical protein
LSRHFVLSDFENVPFKDIGSLKPGECQIKLFIGQNQTKISVELFEALRPFGPDAEVVRISGTGPNALDFHIAFYVGKLAAEFPGSRFSIISGDTGFDPLIKHLASQNIQCVRLPKVPLQPQRDIGPAPVAAPRTAGKMATAPWNLAVTVEPAALVKPRGTTAEANTKSRAAEVVRRLKSTDTKPARTATLRSSIKAYFKPALNDKQVDSVVQSLVDSRKIVIEGTTVTYAL